MVTVTVPAGTRGKDCKVKILKDAVTVDLSPSPPADSSFKKIHLWLYAPVVASESMCACAYIFTNVSIYVRMYASMHACTIVCIYLYIDAKFIVSMR